MKKTLVALVENKPGVLNRVVSLFRRRNFNIDSLTVGRTHDPALARMTIVMDHEADKVREQLKKLINVVEVEDISDVPNTTRELALIKVSAEGSTRSEVLQVCQIFRANVVDADVASVTLEITGSEEKVLSAVEMLRPFGILEMVRTGVVALARGENILSSHDYSNLRKSHSVSFNGNGHSNGHSNGKAYKWVV